MLSMQDFPVDFAAVTKLKWEEEEKKTKMSENEKDLKQTVSTLFALIVVLFSRLKMSLLFHASPFNAKQLEQHRYGLFVRDANGKKIDSS